MVRVCIESPLQQPSSYFDNSSKKVCFQYGSLRKVGSTGPLFWDIYNRSVPSWDRLKSRFLARFVEIRGSSPHATEAHARAFGRILVLHRLDARAESRGIWRPLGSAACSVRANAAP